MSFLDHLRPHLERIDATGEDVGQHRAAVDLLVLAAYGDGSLSDEELHQIEAFDVAHTDWDDSAFDVHTYLPRAAAQVRSGDRAALLLDVSQRLTSVRLRQDAATVAQQIAEANGTQQDQAFLEQLGRVFV